LVELLTGLVFLASWLSYGRQSSAVALVYSALLAGFIVATFIDFEHFIIPDEITLGGMMAGLVASALVPALHHSSTPAAVMRESIVGLAVGAGVIYAILRLGKVLFGRQKFTLNAKTKLVFTESALVLPDQQIPYDEIFYRKSDTIALEAERVELIDRCY